MTTAPLLPLVVIGIPTFNRAELLARAIDSALAQDYSRLAIVIGDNASTDATPQVCQRYADAEPRVNYFRNPVNIGATPNFTEILKRAHGELFMWLGDDDWIDPNFISECVRVLVARHDVVIAGGQAKYYRQGVLQGVGKPTACLSNSPASRVLSYYRQVDDNGIFYGVMRREAAARIEIVNCLGGDWLFMAAMAYQGKVETIHGAFVHREIGGSSESRGKMAKALGVSWWEAQLPLTLPLAFNAAREVASRNRIYRGQGILARLGLAAFVACWICAFKPAQELTRRIRRRILPARPSA
jgi:glycosyltransferase involved in cell wall biosynthesis